MTVLECDGFIDRMAQQYLAEQRGVEDDTVSKTKCNFVQAGNMQSRCKRRSSRYLKRTLSI